MAAAREHGLLVHRRRQARRRAGHRAARTRRRSWARRRRRGADVQGLGADAFTANPLLGRDSLEPLVEAADAAGAGVLRARPHVEPRRGRRAGPRAGGRPAPRGARRAWSPSCGADRSATRGLSSVGAVTRRDATRAARAPARADAARGLPAARRRAPRAAASRTWRRPSRPTRRRASSRPRARSWTPTRERAATRPPRPRRPPRSCAQAGLGARLLTAPDEPTACRRYHSLRRWTVDAAALLRLLAPIALVAFGLALLIVIASARARDEDSGGDRRQASDRARRHETTPERTTDRRRPSRALRGRSTR